MEIQISKIIRSRRRTIELQINSDSTLIVRAPLRVSEKYINKLVYKKRLWISKKQEFMRKQKQLIKQKEFVNGEDFWYLGNAYKLQVIDNSKLPLLPLSFESSSGVFLLSQNHLDKAKELFMLWYKEQARQKITERVNFYCSHADLKYNKIRITDAGSRWGSCGSKNGLNFNWRLIMAPPGVLDYVVVHEIAHITEKNHSKRFWLKVETIFPDYKIHRKWLKENKCQLLF
ncbi:MAG: SprT family zinc-dependent metalloprotease [bacterium]|nr:SprT family zinc-dependent metalloprotease [bacterium]